MEFTPLDHLICAMTDRQKITLQEIVDATKEDPKNLTELINYGISSNILKSIEENSIIFYTLAPYGKQHLNMMNSQIIEEWKKINNAVETKDIETFVTMVEENEIWIKYLRYTKMISADDADFIFNSYNEIKSRQKKKYNSEIYKSQTDAEIERTRALTEQQWKFDDQNYEINREYNNYVDTNYENNY